MKTTAEIIKQLTEEMNELFASYYDILVEYNLHTNLTRITSQKDFWNKHIIDSLLPFDNEINDNDVILDVGTGAGFPGVVLAIAYPNTKITLIESNGKKINFLNKLKKDLDLPNVTIINKRAEEIETIERETFNIVTARAVSATNILIELLSPYIKIGGKLILLKGPKVHEEIKDMKKGYIKLGLEKDFIKEFEIDNNKRFILSFKKTIKTKHIYPRKYSQIKKDPLK